MTIVHLPPMRADLASRLHGIARATPDIARIAARARRFRRVCKVAGWVAEFLCGVSLILLWWAFFHVRQL